MFKSSQRGVSLFLTIIMLSIILAIVFGLSAILISQIRTIQKMGYSVVSFYAADTGTEKALEPVLDYVKEEINVPGSGVFVYPGVPGVAESFNLNGSEAEYLIEIYCCQPGGSCILTSCPPSLDIDPECDATFFCIEALGEYGSTKRAIKTRVFPIPVP